MECQEVDLSDEACPQESQEAELGLASEAKKKRLASLCSLRDILNKAEHLPVNTKPTMEWANLVWDSWRVTFNRMSLI